MTIARFFNRHPLLAERACLALCGRLSERLELEDWRDLQPKRHKIDRQKIKAARARDPARKIDYENFRIELEYPREPPVQHFKRLGGTPSNHCPVCRQPTFSGGDHRQEAGQARWNKNWHACCLAIHWWWKTPGNYALDLALRQGGLCALTGQGIVREGRVIGGVQVDHVVPLWQVRLAWRQYRWPDVLKMWGPRNLQALSADGHARKTADEAKLRAEVRRMATA